jgi:hypothetical protein
LRKFDLVDLMVKKSDNVNIVLSKKTIIVAVVVIAVVCLVVAAFYFGSRYSFVNEIMGGTEGSSDVTSEEGSGSNNSNQSLGGSVSSGSESSGGSNSGDGGVQGGANEDELGAPMLSCLDVCSSEGYGNAKDGSGGAGTCFAYETFVQKDTFDCCCWDEFECEKTDGMNFAMKGTCTDTRTLVDNCFDGNFGDMLTEYFCTDEAESWCSEVVHSCGTDEATCYDGRCIINNLDSDGDGVTDLDEYADGTNPDDPADFADVCAGVDSDNTHLDAVASYQVKGTCTDGEGANEDFCANGWLVEFWCGDAGGCGSDEPTPCDVLLGDTSYCLGGKCTLATPVDCSGLCALAGMGFNSGGFCGEPAEILLGAPCVGPEFEAGAYLFSPEGDMTCNGEALPFNSCCCFIEF